MPVIIKIIVVFAVLGVFIPLYFYGLKQTHKMINQLKKTIENLLLDIAFLENEFAFLNRTSPNHKLLEARESLNVAKSLLLSAKALLIWQKPIAINLLVSDARSIVSSAQNDFNQAFVVKLNIK